MHRWLVAGFSLALAVSVGAQAPRQFRARLSPVPIDITMQAAIAGAGSVTATLSGHTLAVTGTYTGLKSAATVVRVHHGVKTGVRGDAIADLKATGGIDGTISGSVDLTPAQLDELNTGRLYIQLHSEKAPDGNLFGWLLPSEGKKP